MQYFLFFEVGTLIFLSIQGYFDLRILIGLIKDPMNEFGWVEDLIVNPENPKLRIRLRTVKLRFELWIVIRRAEFRLTL